ncbi:protein ECT2 isoform X2 [Anopheles aquasalis]|uniref:protein ECT2 isoform X2 n=1 Tax=Anopheles aquasalis TaxID=42839 RepID=UPI00215AF740|nr:protein ECT2 isoform X2 [Anopheles aquasalis]
MKESLSLHDRKKIAGNGLRPADEEQEEVVSAAAAAMTDKKLISITTSAPNTHSVAKNPLQPIENTATNMDPSAAVATTVVAAGLPPAPPPPPAAATNTSEAMSISSATSSTPEMTRICLVGPVAQDAASVAAAQALNLPFVTSETGAEYLEPDDDDGGASGDGFNTVFVVNDFEGPIYDAIFRAKKRILGPPALQQAVKSKEGLVAKNRPVYNYCMRGVISCFTGIRKKDELSLVVNLIHSMGGSIRKDMNTKVTHLVCKNNGGEKYRYATTFRLAIIHPSWVTEAWERRHDPEFSATTREFTDRHRVKAFDGYKVCFFGFQEDEKQHMIDVLQSNGGCPTELEDPDCTHVVVDEHIVQTKPETKNKNTHIVKADWFWYTIQAGYANEVDYLFADYLESIAHTPAVDRRDSLPVSFNKRKRKLLSQRTPTEGGTPISIGKRRSSVSDAGLLSVSGSFLDCTTSPDKHEASKKNVISEVAEASMEQPSAKTQSMRHNHFMDFFHTESNYVGILDTIVKLFKEPLEEMVENENALLNKSELRSIFGNFLPIHDVHKRMLARLQTIHGHWTEEVLIGQIVLDHRDDLLKAYPPYVNFFEQMKETLVQCDASNPRFHAFLKINQAKPECGRQSLQDLMIRPVQRLPSISLLLNDILKHTPKGNPDSRKLDEALKAIKEVMTYINEDKRKTEGQMALFDIFNDIDNCPPHLVSSHRNFVSRCEVTELSDSLSGRGDPLVLFLFNDTLEVCKKRSRVFHNAKSPNTNTLNLARSSCATTKPYKHLKLMPLSTVRLVVNIEDSPRAFMLNCRELAPSAKDRQYSFNMADEEQDKLVYLRTLSKQMAENACRTDAAHFLINRTAEEVDIDVSDINVGTLSKAFKFASKTRIRVGRAFSFNKTPSKLKRAVSTMMTSPFGSTQSLTPASQMAQMKLASCTNLNEVGEETGESKDGSPSSSTNVLVAPMSVQPTRKNKNPPPSIATLRHL